MRFDILFHFSHDVSATELRTGDANANKFVMIRKYINYYRVDQTKTWLKYGCYKE